MCDAISAGYTDTAYGDMQELPIPPEKNGEKRKGKELRTAQFFLRSSEEGNRLSADQFSSEKDGDKGISLLRMN